MENVLKVNHDPDVIGQFEEYREKVKKSKFVEINRLGVDGNELLQFHGTTITCSLGSNKGGTPSVCENTCCGICRLMRGNEDDVVLCGSSWGAHEKVLAVDIGGCGRKAIVICRVTAGRMEGEEGGFDSVVRLRRDECYWDQELMVLSPRAVLPCFLVIYDVG